MMDRVIEIMIKQWEYDISVMSQPWMYYWLLVPITFYVAFFFVKWSVLTAPLWMPIYMIAKGFQRQ